MGLLNVSACLKWTCFIAIFCLLGVNTYWFINRVNLMPSLVPLCFTFNCAIEARKWTWLVWIQKQLRGNQNVKSMFTFQRSRQTSPPQYWASLDSWVPQLSVTMFKLLLILFTTAWDCVAVLLHLLYTLQEVKGITETASTNKIREILREMLL